METDKVDECRGDGVFDAFRDARYLSADAWDDDPRIVFLDSVASACVQRCDYQTTRSRDADNARAKISHEDVPYTRWRAWYES